MVSCHKWPSLFPPTELLGVLHKTCGEQCCKNWCSIVTRGLKCLKGVSWARTETKTVTAGVDFDFWMCLVHNCVSRIQYTFAVQQVSEGFQVPAMRTLSVLSSRLPDCVAFLSRPSISCLWLFVVGRRWTREKEPEYIVVVRFRLICDLCMFCFPPFPYSGVWINKVWLPHASNCSSSTKTGVPLWSYYGVIRIEKEFIGNVSDFPWCLACISVTCISEIAKRGVKCHSGPISHHASFEQELNWTNSFLPFF